MRSVLGHPSVKSFIHSDLHGTSRRVFGPNSGPSQDSVPERSDQTTHERAEQRARGDARACGNSVEGRARLVPTCAQPTDDAAYHGTDTNTHQDPLSLATATSTRVAWRDDWLCDDPDAQRCLLLRMERRADKEACCHQDHYSDEDQLHD